MKTLRPLRLLPVLCLVSALGAAPADPPPANLEVFLLLGQANMAGRAPAEPEDQRADPRIWTLNDKGRWVPAVEPLHLDKPARAGVGPGLAFARALVAADPTRRIGLVPCAVGGTPLSRWEKDGDLFKAAVARARQAAAAGRLRGALWHQGENDSRAGDPAPTYAERFGRMIGDLRAELGAPRLAFVAAELGAFLDPAVFPQAAMVNAALRDAGRSVPAYACVTVTGLADKGDRSHFSAAAQRELGRRYAREMLKLLEHP